MRAFIASLFVLPVGLLMLAATATAQLFAVLRLAFGWLGARMQGLLELLLNEMGSNKGLK
jgi:hypothetical protein